MHAHVDKYNQRAIARSPSDAYPGRLARYGPLVPART